MEKSKKFDSTSTKDANTRSPVVCLYVVFKDGKVVDMIEVTSPTANKIGQSAKEMRIRENGGNYVKGPDGKPVRIPNNIQTRIERRA